MASNTKLADPNAVVTPFMRMGCTNVTITYRPEGQETVCLQSPDHGMQKLAAFDPSKGDVLGLNDILEHSLAHANLSDLSSYVTSAISAGGTTLFFDPTGHGQTGSAFAFLQGVSTTVSQLVAVHGVAYIPDPVTITMDFNAALTFRPDGLETGVLYAPVPGAAAQQVYGFDIAKSDILELHRVLDQTNANPNLSDIGSYIKATTAGGDTTLSLDPTGAGHVGSAFVVLHGVSASLSQLVGAHALQFTPAHVLTFAARGQVFTYRPEGDQTAVLGQLNSKTGPTTLQNFSVALKDGLDLHNLLGQANIHADMTNIGHYLTATQTGADTTLWLDPTGSGHGGSAIAVLSHTTISVADLISHAALHLT